MECVYPKHALLLLLLIPTLVHCSFSTIGKQCATENEYFDLASLSCQVCGYALNEPSEMLPYSDSQKILGSPTTCACGPGKKRISTESSCFSSAPNLCSLYECESCPDGHAPSQDKSQCLDCGNAGVNSATNDCACPANYMLVEYDADQSLLTEKSCQPCPQNSYSSEGAYSCIACSDPNMIFTPESGCTCDSPTYEAVGSTEIGELTCIEKSKVDSISIKYPSSGATRITYKDFQEPNEITVVSVMLKHYYMKAAAGCYYFEAEENVKDCQVLANICVLMHFDPESTICSLFNFIKDSRTATIHGVDGWSNTLPLLTYKDRATATLEKTDIKMKSLYTNIKGCIEAKTLSYRLAKYSFNGSFVGFEELGTQFFYCGLSSSATNGPSYNTRWLKYGFGYSEDYNCDLETLLNEETYFYELFLVDDDNTEETLYPVPVRVLNYRGDSDSMPNLNSLSTDEDDDRLSHRFFLYDTKLSRESTQSEPQAIRYAQRITLQVRAQRSNSDQIYPPVLTIQYVDTVSPTVVSVEFKAEYTADTSGFWSTALALFLTICALSCFTIVLRYFNWQRRNSRGGMDPLAGMSGIVRFIVLIASFFSQSCFWLLYFLSTYYLIAFKLSTSVGTLLPEDNEQFTTENEYYTFQVLLVICFGLQFISLADTIYRQTSVDIFFMDWEKPRAKLLDSESIKCADAPVSIWRTILVANEWNEMQSIRQTSIEFTLIFIGFLLVGLKLEFLATPQPTASDLSPGPINLYLRFANTSFWWLVISYTQYAWKWLVYERCIDEPKANQFVDLCTMAKVSCLILDEKYHGYYLHCRSPYPFADGSMVEIADQLKQEEAGLMSGRGLQGGPTDLQAFELFITYSWRKNYDKIFATLLNQISNKAALETGRLGSVHGHKNKKRSGAPPSKLVKASRKLNLFLKSFIENHESDYRWKILNKQGLLSRYLEIPPEMGSKRISVMLPDDSYSFSKVLFLGIESDLIIFNILTLSVFDLCFGNTTVSFLLTYLVERTMVDIRNRWGSKNVAEKTLVDDRFLT